MNNDQLSVSNSDNYYTSDFFSSVTVANLADSWNLTITKAKKAVGEEFMYSSMIK